MLGLILMALMLQGPRNIQLEGGPKPPIVIEKGTVIPVELTKRLSTKNIKEGDQVFARTVFPISVNNKIAIPVGTDVLGVIKEVKQPGRVKGKASLTLSFQMMTFPDGVKMPIYATLGNSDTGHREGEATIQGESSKGKDVGSIAKAGAVGGVLGGVFGGGKGAAIGGGASATVALAGVLLSRGEDLTLEKGTTIEIVLDEQIEI
jgi:type IV secretion system protein VirB10